MKCKRGISLALVFVMIIAAFSAIVIVQAEENHVDVNRRILENVLSEKPWIVETLVDGRVSNNPYAVVNLAATSGTVFDEVLENYKNDKSFKALVDAMEVYANSGEYIGGFADDILTVLMQWFGNNESVDKAIASVAELKYESILNEAIKTDYTSTWGDTLLESNAVLEFFKQQANIYKKLGAYQKAIKDAAGLKGTKSQIVFYDPQEKTNDERYVVTFNDYADNLVGAYKQDLKDYLENTIEVNFPSLAENTIDKKVLSVGAATILALYERTQKPSAKATDDIYYNIMINRTVNIVKGAGKAFELSEKTFNCAALLEAMNAQSDTIVEVMSRLKNITDDKDLIKVLDNYSDLFNSAGNDMALAYESVEGYLRKQGTITNVISESVGKGMKSLMTSKNMYIKTFSMTLNEIAKAAKIVGLGVLIADVATNIKDTAKKIYICKYTQKLINQAVKVYKDDLKKYKSDKTDENAKKVLDDLQFLKQLRLFGEKTAYESMSAQMDSFVGELLGGGDTKEHLDNRYQNSIDFYLGCSFMPSTQNPLVLSKGDVLTIQSETINGKTYTIAAWKKQDGKTVYFAEADLRLMGGIELNGATVNITSASSGFYLPCVDNEVDGGKIIVFCNDVSIGQISNSAEMTVELKQEGLNFKISDSIKNSGNLSIKGVSGVSAVPVYDVKNNKNIDLINVKLNVKGDINNNGKITGTVVICGDNTMSYNNAYYRKVSQSVSGTGNYDRLCFENYTSNGVKIYGTHTVAEYTANKKTRIRTPENLVLTGNCAVGDNYFNGGVTLKNFSSAESLTFKGTVRIAENVTLEGDNNFDGLCMTEQAVKLALKGDTTVKEDFLNKAGTIEENGRLIIKGNFDITSAQPYISNLCFDGSVAQSIQSKNTLKVGSLINKNRSIGGLSIDSRVDVTKELYSAVGTKYQNSTNIYLIDSATVTGSKVNGSLSSENWTCNGAVTLKGSLFAKGNTEISANSSLSVLDFIQSDGSLKIGNGAVVNCSGSFKNSGTVESLGSVNVKEDSKIESAFNGGTFVTGGDMTVSAAFSPDNLTLNGKMNQNYFGNAQTSVKNLTVENSSAQGLQIQGKIIVSESFDAKHNKIIGGKNVVLVNAAKAEGLDNGNDISSEGWTCSKDTVIKGNLYASGDTTLLDGVTLNVSNYIQSGGTLCVGEGSSLECNGDIVTAGAVTNSGSIVVGGDGKISSTLTGGTFTAKGDIEASADFSPDKLIFNAALGQRYYSSGKTQTKVLTINNTSSEGFNAASVIYVAEEFKNNCKKLVNGQNIIVSGKADSEINGDLSVEGEYTVEAGKTQTVFGSLKVKSGAVITVEQGAVLEIKRMAVSVSSTFNVEDGGTLIINDYLDSSADTFNVNGEMKIKGDAKMSQSVVNADGEIVFLGDLNVSAGTWNNPNISFCGKLPQTVSGSQINVGNLALDNPSKKGITFNSKVNYYGLLSKNATVINESNLTNKS